MAEFKIESGIPIQSNPYNRKYITTLRKLNVGDSFAIPVDNRPNRKNNILAALSGSVKIIKLKENPDFKITSTYIKSENILRVWRVQ